MLNTLQPYVKFCFLSNIFCLASSPLFSFPFFLLPAVPAFLPLPPVFLFPCLSEILSTLFPLPPLFSFFLRFHTPFPNIFPLPAPFRPNITFLNISRKHADSSFCRPKRRTRQIIKVSPRQQECIKNTRPDRPKFRTSKHQQNKFCLRPGKYAKRQKNKGFPVKTKALPVPNRKCIKRSKNRQPN